MYCILLLVNTRKFLPLHWQNINYSASPLLNLNHRHFWNNISQHSNEDFIDSSIKNIDSFSDRIN